MMVKPWQLNPARSLGARSAFRSDKPPPSRVEASAPARLIKSFNGVHRPMRKTFQLLICALLLALGWLLPISACSQSADMELVKSGSGGTFQAVFPASPPSRVTNRPSRPTAPGPTSTTPARPRPTGHRGSTWNGSRPCRKPTSGALCKATPACAKPSLLPSTPGSAAIRKHELVVSGHQHAAGARRDPCDPRQ